MRFRFAIERPESSLDIRTYAKPRDLRVAQRVSIEQRPTLFGCSRQGFGMVEKANGRRRAVSEDVEGCLL